MNKIIIIFLTFFLLLIALPSFGEKYVITKTWLWGLKLDDVKRVQTSSTGILYSNKEDCEKDLLYLASGSIISKLDSNGVLHLQNFEKNQLLDLVSFFTCTKLYGSYFD